jgi:hypothetical protein
VDVEEALRSVEETLKDVEGASKEAEEALRDVEGAKKILDFCLCARPRSFIR